MLVFKGLPLALLGGMSVGPFPVAFQRLSSGFIPDVFGGEAFNYTALFLGTATVATLVTFSLPQPRQATASTRSRRRPSACSLFKNGLLAVLIIAFCS